MKCAEKPPPLVEYVMLGSIEGIRFSKGTEATKIIGMHLAWRVLAVKRCGSNTKL